MTKAVWTAITTAAAVLFFSASAHAQVTAPASLNVSVNVGAKAKLTLGTASITFADAVPTPLRP